MFKNVLSKTTILSINKINPNLIKSGIKNSHTHSKTIIPKPNILNNISSQTNDSQSEFNKNSEKIKNIVKLELEKNKSDNIEFENFKSNNPNDEQLNMKIKLIVANEINKINMEQKLLEQNNTINKNDKIKNISSNTNISNKNDKIKNISSNTNISN